VFEKKVEKLGVISMYTESKSLELKESFSSSFLKTVSAFANERDGKIIFGVSDDGTIIGVEKVDELKLRIENIINDSIDPIPSYELETKNIDNKDIIVLRVYEGDEQPYFYKHLSYRRSDTSSVPVGKSQLKRWIMETDNIHFDRQIIKEKNFEFNSLKKALTQKISIESFNNDTLRTMGLMVGNDYTKAGELFADKNDFSVGVDTVKFGRDISEFLKRKTLTRMTLLEQYYQTMDFFDEVYHEYEAVTGAYRVKRIMIPREAFREALANAIVHKDYMFHSNIRISFWDDHIEIFSPGGLTKGITEEKFKDGTVSSLRNEVIASVFQRLGIIETFATGIKRIKKAYLEYPEKPKFEVTDDYIIVKLPRVDYRWKDALDSRTNEIIDFLENQPRSSSEIQEKLQLSKTKVNEHLVMLQELGQVEKVGSGRATKYQLLKLTDDN